MRLGRALGSTAVPKVRIVGISGGEIAHEAVSRRPPISLYSIVARTHMYTHDATV
jgi:hypothetical protein